MSATVNAFPPLQSMTSPRGWVLAIIIGLHALFFWAFTSGLGSRIVTQLERDFEVIDLPQPTAPPTEPMRQPTLKFDPEMRQPVVQRPVVPMFEPEHMEGVIEGTPLEALPFPTQGSGPDTRGEPAPVIEVSSIDARLPLSEPDYPASEVRQGHAGTVLLSIYVLENGRVGDVRIDRAASRNSMPRRLAKPGAGA